MPVTILRAGRWPWRTSRRRPSEVTSSAYLSSKLATLGFDRLPKKCLRPVAQDLGQRISESPWLGELQNVSVGHGVSSFDGKWRLRTPLRYATSSLHAVTNFRV